MMKLIKATCLHCSHKWMTMATTILVTCPSCGRKTKNRVRVAKKPSRPALSRQEVNRRAAAALKEKIDHILAWEGK